MKNITLSAPEELIEAARTNAANKGTTLNNEFREWLRLQAARNRLTKERFNEIINQVSYVKAGRKFTREEMNER